MKQSIYSFRHLFRRSRRNFLRHPPLYPTCPLLFLFLFLNTNFSFHTILRYFIVFNFPTPDSQSTNSPTRPTFPKPNLRHIFPANNHVDLNSIFFESICFFPFCCTTTPGFPIAVERGSLLYQVNVEGKKIHGIGEEGNPHEPRSSRNNSEEISIR